MLLKRLAVVLSVLALSACSSSGAPVIDLYTLYSQHGNNITPVRRGSYMVRHGDTLYSIAYRHGWSFRRLAQANNIPPPYTIYPGQVIHFDASLKQSNERPSPAPASSATSSSSQTAEPAEPPPQRSAEPRPQPSLPSGSPEWQWPATGKLLTHFGDKGSEKGINIGGEQGSAIKAAAAGVVVYRASNIRGYGNLLIIKHNHKWLSAYAHVANMQVKEGEPVKAGETIAAMSNSGTWRRQLYFEIRKQGDPVNPLELLPSR